MVIFIANNLSKLENKKSTKRNKEGCLHTEIQIKASTNHRRYDVLMTYMLHLIDVLLFL